ncbi:unnamed protein product [Ambrosiozyma monospora]|uniref:Unnamed protein product n=1 Tax=Ambrosiozyma monospora TaxID=43982 RepID=A0A9W6Z1U2_AMBMO|nr:unnamed protein product [Ambrosiozyma monospora]
MLLFSIFGLKYCCGFTKFVKLKNPVPSFADDDDAVVVAAGCDVDEEGWVVNDDVLAAGTLFFFWGMSGWIKISSSSSSMLKLL